MRDVINWFVSDRSLPIRITVGVLIFACLAIVDWRAHRERATRWREYAFLVLCLMFAITYGIVNDLITSRISVEYFLYGKGVADRISTHAAAHPNEHRFELDLQAIRIGVMASWSAGLIAGAALLMTNSIGVAPRLRVRRMLHLIPVIGLAAIACAVAGGCLGASGALTNVSNDFRAMVANDEMRPYRFMAVFGIHLGGYVGALVGLMICCARIVHLRRKCPPPAG